MLKTETTAHGRWVELSLLLLGTVASAGCGDGGQHSQREGIASVSSRLSTVLPAIADTRLEEKNPYANYGNESTHPNASTLYAAGNVNGICQLAETALKFDVSSAAGRIITGARLRLYVTRASETGQFELFRLGRDWDEMTTTWYEWAPGASWAEAGANGPGDHGPAVRGSFTGTSGTGYREFPLNADGVILVQGWLDGSSVNNGLLLRPTLSSPCSNAADYFGFSSRETANPPQLIIDYESTSEHAREPVGDPVGDPVHDPVGDPEQLTTTSIKVVTWNVADNSFLGAGQDFLVQQRPQVAFLQEVDSEALVSEVVAKLRADQGGDWYSRTICRGEDSCASNVVIVSRFPLDNVAQLDLRTAGTYVIPCYSESPITWPGRRALAATIVVNGRTLSVFSVRMSSDSNWDCVRDEEVTSLKAWAAANYPLPHIFGGDFNQQPDDTSTVIMGGYPLPNTDSWAEAVASGGAIPAFATLDGSPNFFTPTKSTRLDYVFYTKETPYLSVTGVAIIDSGGLSDHRAMETTFEVR